MKIKFNNVMFNGIRIDRTSLSNHVRRTEFQTTGCDLFLFNEREIWVFKVVSFTINVSYVVKIVFKCVSKELACKSSVLKEVI